MGQPSPCGAMSHLSVVEAKKRKQKRGTRFQRAFSEARRAAAAERDQTFEETERQLHEVRAARTKMEEENKSRSLLEKARQRALEQLHSSGRLRELPSLQMSRTSRTEQQETDERAKIQSLRQREARLQAEVDAEKRKRVEEDEELRRDVAAATSLQVHRRCEQQVKRMHDSFLRKQGQLSTRLQRRVKRLQLDYQEIQERKVSHIMPSPALDGGVLDYLQQKRHLVERERRSRHTKYLQQVDRFQQHLRRLADPNRSLDRGEVYLSECFRHVLSAGLVVDSEFFLRTLSNLEPDDFQRPHTVNLLAACCHSFDVDLRLYWGFLLEKGLPCLSPKPCPEKVRRWQDWEPWCGFDLQDLMESAQADDIEVVRKDPLPFAPMVPDEPVTESELVSRDDPLADILTQVTLDSPLTRYPLQRPPWRPQRSCSFASSFAGSSSASDAASADSATYDVEEDSGEDNGDRLSSLQSRHASHLSRSPKSARVSKSAAAEARTWAPPQSARSRRRYHICNGHPTLRAVRGLPSTGHPPGQQADIVAPGFAESSIDGPEENDGTDSAEHLE